MTGLGGVNISIIPITSTVWTSDRYVPGTARASHYLSACCSNPSSIPFGPQNLGPGWAKLGPNWAPVRPNWGPFGNAAWEANKLHVTTLRGLTYNSLVCDKFVLCHEMCIKVSSESIKQLP